MQLEAEQPNKRRHFVRQTTIITLLASLPNSLKALTLDVDDINIPTKGYAAFATNGILKPFSFDRRAVGSDDLKIEILFCGVYHSDIHTV